MKKKIIKDVLLYFLLVVVSYLLQTTLFKWIEIRGISPNLLIVVVVSISLLKGRLYGSLVGVFIGIFCDAFYGGPFGFYSIVYMNVGFFCGYLHNIFYKDNIVLPLILMGISSILVNYMEFFFGYVFRGKLSASEYVGVVFLPDLLYTLFIGFIGYHFFYLILSPEKQEEGE